jgi:hypothetical protein
MELRQLSPFVLIEGEIEYCSISEVTLENYSGNLYLAILWNYNSQTPATIRISEAMSSELNTVISQVIEAVRSSNLRRNRCGQDLYVRRTDGFEKVYKNNSDYYRTKVKENQGFRKKEGIKTPSTAKLASRTGPEVKSESFFWKKRRNYNRMDSDKKERVSLADITNMQPRRLDFA